jgi:hypothetical protein
MAFAERATAVGGTPAGAGRHCRALTGTHGQVGVLRLYAMANWLLGRR